MKNNFVKSHGLGNDYIVINSENIYFPINSQTAKLICDVHYGIGSDGLLVKVPSNQTDFKVKMYNPDGSIFEKSGNGLRIFSKYLYDYGFAKNELFTIETDGGIVKSEIISENDSRANVIKVDMGTAEFASSKIPVNIDKSECINKNINVLDKNFQISCVSMGNPHCVVFRDELNIDEIMKYGTYIENHKIFPNRTNVQFAKYVTPTLAEILIWERGVGFTLASGSSSCAVAAVLNKMNKVNDKVTISMPGGVLQIECDYHFNLTMTGEVEEIIHGTFSHEFLAKINDMIV